MRADERSTTPTDPALHARGWPEGFGGDPVERPALLILASLRGISPRDLRDLAWQEGGPRACLGAIRRGSAGSENDREHASSIDPAQVERAIERCGARFLGFHDPGYPSDLGDLQRDPPGWLFVRGRPFDEAEDRVAVVGSRRCSALGREIAHDLGRRLAAAGVTVVSGAAYGIDAASHEGAFTGGGATIAVLGSGIDEAYPRSSRRLIERIAREQVLVSEYAPGTPAEPHRFPARNRIIAGLARALVVVEGADGSGSRISVDHALDIGREVFAIPGPVTSPLAEVPLAIIREGATMIRGADDLLDDLGIVTKPRLPSARPDDLSAEETMVWDALEGSSLPDAVAREVGVSIADAVGLLIRLELRGLVRSVGGRYERTLAGLGTAPAERVSDGGA